jgi:hypothetical protein
VGTDEKLDMYAVMRCDAGRTSLRCSKRPAWKDVAMRESDKSSIDRLTSLVQTRVNELLLIPVFQQPMDTALHLASVGGYVGSNLE